VKIFSDLKAAKSMDKNFPMKSASTTGEILLEDYLMPLGISQNALAGALGISPRSINEIVLGRRSMTPEMSLKLGEFFK
jgi:addiction module HigA family antidote